MGNCRFLLTIFILLCFNKYCNANKTKLNNYRYAVWNYKFEYIKCISNSEEFYDFYSILNLSKSNLSDKNQYFKNNLPYNDSFYYIALVKDTIDIQYLDKALKNIKVHFELDYKAYWNQIIEFQNFNFYKKDDVNSNHTLFSSIIRVKEILPDAHWILYQKNKGILVETIVKDGLFDKYLIFYDYNSKSELKEIYSIKKGYFHGISFIKLFKDSFIIHLYDNGRDLQSIIKN